MAGGMHGGGVHDGGGACMAGETATATGSTHPTGMHSCLLLCAQIVLTPMLFVPIQFTNKPLDVHI